MNKRIKLLTSLAASVLLALIVYKISVYNDTADVEQVKMPVDITELKKEPITKFGLPVDSFEVAQHIVEAGESFSNILLANGIDYGVIHNIAENFKEVFDVRHLRTGKPYTLFCEADQESHVARYMVYEPSPTNYIVFDLNDSVSVYTGEKEVSTRTKSVSGIITASLYESLRAQRVSPALTMRLADVYAWSIDFFRIQKGDSYKVIYEEKFIDDTVSVGIGRIIAADFNHNGADFYSFYYSNGEDYSDYFDEKGGTLRKAFLKAPLNFSRISSRYTPKRFHPVLKRWKAHLGTDYAAPRGTPIMSTANGTVIASSYTAGNGNYVKIQHNSTYTTQYLHMSKFAAGMKKGKVVKQGEVIGYVGSTGLATGPHVCYRFWKNGKQVDPYKQDLPEAEPIKEEYKADYEKFMNEWKVKLDAMKLPDAKKKDEVLVASLLVKRFGLTAHP
jgi:murein DD-endopeptidase MepM/ murein hydrolase activator NlpD